MQRKPIPGTTDENGQIRTQDITRSPPEWSAALCNIGAATTSGTLYHTQPGDIIVADEDGAVAVPVDLAEEVIAKASEHHEWEEFSRERLAAGGELKCYYPLSDEARSEYTSNG